MHHFQQARQALGSEVILTILTARRDAQLDSMFDGLWNHLEGFEERFSRFRTTSETTRVNVGAGSWVEVSPEFMEMLRLCTYWNQKTAGLFNPLVLPQLQRAGYVGSWPDAATVTPQLDYRQRNVAAWTEIETHGSRVRLPKSSALDLGGIGKGLALDQLAAVVASVYPDFCLSLGGDIVCGGRGLTGAWEIEVMRASNTDEAAAVYQPAGDEIFALATSGVTNRQGITNGQPWHHIIDPRTGMSSKSNVLTASVVAETGIAADILAKCVVITGSKNAEMLLTQLAASAWLLQTEDEALIIQNGGFRIC
ncbi:FAD:protein FMN transferase [Candidatus Saccharibacteria bacterium]|nr:FAD:protein FMN transferase [Candidatus Saccharibacteria bacterium]